MKIDCISDLHGHYPQLPGGDLLIVAGDLTARDTYEDWLVFHDWFGVQKYKKRIVIAGNHDNSIQKRLNPGFWNGGTYLEDSGTEFMGYRIWGSPWSKTFPGMNPKCKAFTVDTEEELAEKWALIPDDIDILITHSPPIGIMDEVEEDVRGKYRHTGSISLLHKAGSLPNLKLHVFGHIHQGYGHIDTLKIANSLGSVILEKISGPKKCKSYPHLVNASHVNERYQPVNKPIRIEL